MDHRFLRSIVAISLAMGVAFGVLAIRKQHQVHHLTIATGGKQGQYFAFSQALAQVVAQHYPRIQLTVLATEGSNQNMELLERHEVDFALVQDDTSSQPSTRMVAALFPELFHLLAAPDSDIQQIADLRGKRVALMPEGSGSNVLFWRLAGHYGLTPVSLHAVALTPEAAAAKFQAGKVDALARVMALGNPAMQRLLQASQARLMPVEQVEALQITQPFLRPVRIPEGAYGGEPPIPASDLPTLAVQAILLAHKDVNPTIVRDITGILNEHRSELIALYPGAATIRVPTRASHLGIPLHVGAESYYDQDRPNFLATYSEAIGLALSLGVLAISGGWQARQRWLDRQKNRADAYNLEILALIEQVQSAQTVERLQEIRQQLFDILKKVVEDLDLDRITPESFASFAFPWEVAIASIRHRELLLLYATSTKPSDPKS
jgi:TRAP transporter TAXI family solute receptor